MTRRTLLLLTAIVLSAWSASACRASTSDSLTFGAILSLTGGAAPYGEDNRRGLELALEVINENGGILGKPVELDIQDSAGDSAQAVTLARRFAGDTKVAGILGPTRTGETVAVSKILPELQIPMMSVGSTGDWRSAAGEFNQWTFRSTRVDTYLIEPLLRAAKDKFGVKTVAVIYTSNDDYSVSVEPVYEEAIKSLGLQLVAKESQTGGDTDRSAQLTKIKGMNPDALIINTLSTDAPSIAEQARRVGLNARFIGTAGFSNPGTWKLASEATLDGTLVGDNFYVGSSRPVVAEFVRRYRAKFNAEPPAYAAYAYDGLLVLADAVKRSGGQASREAVRDALASTRDFEGVLGTLNYRGSGDADKPAVILTIAKGQYQLVQ